MGEFSGKGTPRHTAAAPSPRTQPFLDLYLQKRTHNRRALARRFLSAVFVRQLSVPPPFEADSRVEDDGASGGFSIKLVTPVPPSTEARPTKRDETAVPQRSRAKFSPRRSVDLR
ncbi:hypothetical protein AAFF_G00414470 [Aldrovandia affinis]|uniref:Uncharacterized protein n=1 Tax=Aldrovandia affinis TaxID=143900 RepID=A0AAD7SAZ2_9TELE|nr:hypothetical protein AAFF_G00414470 [Aldrovandia affinis]